MGSTLGRQVHEATMANISAWFTDSKHLDIEHADEWCEVHDSGWPDFIFLGPGGDPWCIELKGPNDNVRPNQASVHELLRIAEIPVLILRWYHHNGRIQYHWDNGYDPTNWEQEADEWEREENKAIRSLENDKLDLKLSEIAESMYPRKSQSIRRPIRGETDCYRFTCSILAELDSLGIKPGGKFSINTEETG